MKKASTNRQTLSADGTTIFFKYLGPVVVTITGTFDGGTAKIQRKNNAGATVDVVGAAYTTDAEKRLDYAQSATNWLAINLAGATTPSLVIEIQDGERASGRTDELP